MPVKTIAKRPGLITGSMVLISPKTGLPRILGNLWLSLNELKYSTGYAAQHLRTLEMLYVYFENRSDDLKNLDEIRFRNNSPDFDSSKVSQSLSHINTLYHFLRPPRASKIRKLRSLPAPVVDELLSLLEPNSIVNPFRTRKLKLRRPYKPIKLGLAGGFFNGPFKIILRIRNCQKMGRIKWVAPK